MFRSSGSFELRSEDKRSVHCFQLLYVVENSDMRWHDLELLEEVGLTLYERKALATLMVEGVADAETLCREGEVPSSKIYQAMEKLDRLGLVEIQPTRPRLYSAFAVDEVVGRLIAISRERADRFSEQAEKLRSILASHAGRVHGRKTFVDLALGMESHVKRHVMHLAAAQHRIWSYMERGDLEAIESAAAKGFPVLRRIARNATEPKTRPASRLWFRLPNGSTTGWISAQAQGALGTCHRRALLRRTRSPLPCH